jgi:hypothetical protein
VPSLVTAAVVVTLVVVAVIFARTDAGRKLLDSSTSDATDATAAQPIAVSRTLSFDPPPGSGTEHDNELPALVDGDPTTTWSTERYDGTLASLKPGVGVVLVLDGPHKLGQLKVTTPTKGWTAQAFVSDSPRSTLKDWGTPVSTRRNIDGVTTFDLGGRNAGAVLLWITDLGDGNSSVSIGELQVAPS